MPCNSDYMEPTASEVRSLSEKAMAVKEVADQMVFAADVLRDVLIDSKGKLTKEKRAIHGFVLGKYLGEYDFVISHGAEVREAIKKEYAYRMGHDNVERVYIRARSEYEVVIELARRLVAGDKIYAKEYKDIEKTQIIHRKGDITRLIQVFARKQDFKMVAKLATVDFTLPLEPQIGFEPDSI